MAKDAQAECEKLGGTLPLPANSAQNEDFRLAVRSIGVRYPLLGISDPGPSLPNQTTNVSEEV